MAGRKRIEVNETFAKFVFYLFSVIYFFCALTDNLWILYCCYLDRSMGYNILDTLLTVAALGSFAIVCFMRAITYPECYYQKAFIPAFATVAGLMMWANLDWLANRIAIEQFHYPLFLKSRWVCILIGLPLYFIIRRLLYRLGSLWFEPITTVEFLQELEAERRAREVAEPAQESSESFSFEEAKHRKMLEDEKKREAFHNAVPHTCAYCRFYPDNCSMVYDHRMNGTPLPDDCRTFRRKDIM